MPFLCLREWGLNSLLLSISTLHLEASLIECAGSRRGRTRFCSRNSFAVMRKRLFEDSDLCLSIATEKGGVG